MDAQIEMKNIKVRSSEEWEELCEHLMPVMAKSYLKQNRQFHRYGGSGQNQYGLDIVSKGTDADIIAQCKFTKTFTYKQLEDELKKSDDYPFKIEAFFLLTTAPKHTSIENKRYENYLTHERPDGSVFRIYTIYWDDIHNLNFLPRDVVDRLFPEIKEINPNFDEISLHINQLDNLKSTIPVFISLDDIIFLDSWNFNLGYIKDVDYNPFRELWFLYRDVNYAFRYNDKTFLTNQNLIKIYKCLPAGKKFFEALSEFRNAIESDCIGGEIGSEYVLTVADVDENFAIRRRWKDAARYLSQTYREMIGPVRLW